MKVSLLSLGCKVNQAEIYTMETALFERGHEVVGLDDEPELCIVNTCSVTAKSDYQSRQLIRRARKAGARVMVTGCYSELNKEEVAAMEGIEAVIDNDRKSNIIDLLSSDTTSATLNYRSARTRRMIKVQDGCDYTCSYCVIWKARGRSRSVGLETVISSVKRAIADGTREIVLTGIHLGLYGRDHGDTLTLSGLLERILLDTEVERVRLSSLEINEVDDRLMELMDDRRVCRHLHVPLQSGDDEVLRLMNRTYDTGDFERKLNEIAARLEGVAIGTDVIAGFPGETDGAFENTVDMVGRLPFSYIHVFPYSRRPGTKAAGMKDMVGAGRRKERAAILRRISREMKQAYMKDQIGRVLDVLVEEEVAPDLWRGTSDNYMKVTVGLQTGSRGSIVPVRVTGAEEEFLTGKPSYTL